MRWRLRLGEFEYTVQYKIEYTVQYKIEYSNTQGDALSRLRTLGETVVPIEEEIAGLYV